MLYKKIENYSLKLRIYPNKKQVRHALIDRDMTMTDLANELGITISYVSDLLKGKRTNQEQLQRIKEFLEITDTDDYEE